MALKYKLIIDKESEEQIIAIVQAPGKFTEQIENLVLSYSGKDTITGYTDDGITQLLGQVTCLARGRPSGGVQVV